MVEIGGSKLQELVLLLSVLNNKNKVEGAVLLVFLVKQFRTILHRHLAQILVEIDENRMDRFELTSLDVLHELAALVAVHFDWRDGRLVNLLLVRVWTLTLVDEGIGFGLEILLGHVHHVLLANLRQAIHQCHLVSPFATSNEIAVHFAGASLIAFQRTHLLQLEVVDDGFQHRLVEITVLQFLHLSQHQVFYLVERLSFLWYTHQHELTVVCHAFVECQGFEHFLLLRKVNIDETALSVLKHALHDFEVV